jgi:hypothetical protein
MPQEEHVVGVPRYLFITEGGEKMFTTEDDPTEVDRLCVKKGTISIVRLSDMAELEYRKKLGPGWVPLPSGKLNKKSDPTGPFHEADD